MHSDPPQRRVQKTTAALRLCARRRVAAVLYISAFFFFFFFSASFSDRILNEWMHRQADYVVVYTGDFCRRRSQLVAPARKRGIPCFNLAES